MTKKLIFNKIAKDSPYSGVGTAGNIFMILNSLFLLKENEKIYIDMYTNPTFNNEVEKVHDTYNAFEYYFDQIENPKESEEIDFYHIPRKLYYDYPYTKNSKKLLKVRELFWKNFALKSDLRNFIDNYFELHLEGKVTLGVQVRLTDMKVHGVATVDDYILKVKNILLEYPEINNVFLATDDFDVIERFQIEFKSLVVYLENIYRASKEQMDLDPYDRYNVKRRLHKYMMGKEVLFDVFLLSKCQFLLKADRSAVSQLALIFSNSYKKVFLIKEYTLVQRIKSVIL